MLYNFTKFLLYKQNKFSTYLTYIFNIFVPTTKISWNCAKFGWTPRSVTSTKNLLAVVADVVDDHAGVEVVVSLELQPPRRPRGNFGQVEAWVEGGTKKWTRTFFGGSFKAVRNFLQLLHGVWYETKSEAIFTQIAFIFTKFLRKIRNGKSISREILLPIFIKYHCKAEWFFFWSGFLVLKCTT